jgi:acetyl-CoA C-acetyltransferase
MFLDGLEDAYDKGRLMGTFAEDCAETNGFSREAQDAFAIASLTRAQQAIKDGSFSRDRAGDRDRGKEQVISNDEQPPKAKLDKIAS